MNVTHIAPVSYDIPGAALAAGVSTDTIRRGINAGDIAVRYPVVDGRPIAKPLIEAAELARWVGAGKTERAAS
jgi:hypothetical protein